MTLLFGFAVSLGAGFFLAGLWRRLGLGDGPEGAQAGRKLQVEAIPAVGGLAIACAWAAELALAAGSGGGALAVSLQRFAPRLPGYPTDLDPSRAALGALFALACAGALGVVDDGRREGLGPLAKLAGQALAGALLGLPLIFPGEAAGPGLALALAWSAAYGAAGMVACNALNTFDNADGAAAGISTAGLAAAASPLAPAVGGILVLQLGLRRQNGALRIYLGDGGSHLLGLLALVVPGAWPLLWLPGLDLARVAVARMRAGRAPWHGDRLHLAHRLERSGQGPLAVCAWLLGLAAPCLLFPGPPGLLASCALFGLALHFTRRAAVAVEA
ncbi:MAG: hypothetical protein ABGY71_01665 [bacterium]|nr:hypothetical protein [Planctomycetota bacterium]HIL51451.1 hypothetical protein [Planctomycetota bacterium]